MAGQYTYLVGLLIFGAILGAVGLIAAERERRARRLAERSPEQLPRGLTSSPAAPAR
jgi:hypothetical protein